MGYNTQQKPVKKLDFSNMRTNTSEKKVIVRDYMHDYKRKIEELRQRLYQLMRITNETS